MTTVQTVNDEAQPCTTTVHDDDAPACTATGHDGRADKHIDIATLTACSDDDRMAADRQAYLDLWETRPAGFALAPATPAAGALAGAPALPAASSNGVEPPVAALSTPAHIALDETLMSLVLDGPAASVPHRPKAGSAESEPDQPDFGGSTGLGEPSDMTCRRIGARKKLKNRSLTRDEAHEYIVRSIAKVVLQDWYSTGYSRANALMPRIQIDDNLKKVASIPGWEEEKGLKNGYVMLLSSLSGREAPVILQLARGGRITYRQLHHQVRAALQLEPKHSLRMCPFRPWYRHMTGSIPVPEKRALPASNGQCRHLLGTTLWYYCYVHLH